MTYTRKLWAGFSSGRLHFVEIDDLSGGSNHRYSPSLFKTLVEARSQYNDVPLVEVREVKSQARKSKP